MKRAKENSARRELTLINYLRENNAKKRIGKGKKIRIFQLKSNLILKTLSLEDVRQRDRGKEI